MRGECTRVTATGDLASVTGQLNVLESSLRNLTYSSELLGVEESLTLTLILTLTPSPDPSPDPSLTQTLVLTLTPSPYPNQVLSSSEPTYPQLLLGAPASPPPSPPLGGACSRVCRSQTCASFLGDFTCEELV